MKSRLWLIWMFLMLAAAGSAASIEGVYLADGVMSLLEINPTVFSFKSDFIYGESRYGKPAKIITRPDGFILIFELKIFSGIHAPIERTALFFTPSQSIKGDWDLAQISQIFDDIPTNKLIRFMYPLKKNVPSALHRVEDKRVIEYYKQLGESKKTTRSNLALAEDIWKAAARDFWARAIFLNALIINEKWEKAEYANNLWKSDLQKSPNPFIKQIPENIEQCLAFHRLSSEGQNAWDYIIEIGDNTNKEPFENILEKAASCKGCIQKIYPLTIGDNIFQNYLIYQVNSKILGVKAIFAMLEGENARALHLLRLTYLLSQFLYNKTVMNTNTTTNLINIAIKSVSCNGLQIYLLNACSSPDEIKEFYDMFRKLKDIDDETPIQFSLKRQMPDLDYMPEEVKSSFIWEEMSWATIEAKSLLLLMAAAARYRFLTNGQFPKEAAEFAPLMKEGLPQDPFGNQPLKFIAEKEPFTVYSIGPDKKDEKAAIAYDPTNGTTSAGDIFIEIPRERKYPFPPKGKLAATKEGILKQFPNDLPPDPFHDDRNAPLSVTDETPARIFSFGPNCDSSRVKDGKGLMPLEPPYDPTNGIQSAGDLIMHTRP
ncbi:MAG TPA: hypothetical protein PKW18_04220 [Candidatus Sumerlaeota bacterium]|nr:hypothetical protein [Candidatus Sumerlaeota bacterium]HON51290.1 hypothetical protein [Candidatus Sumerlaeota bacterium]HOR65668.1 hypothetical protein [Candidatus Sumerlaeota bacterium]HPL73761.1 hypothetical protein [Candidatus Sumerlaeota bacterium]HRU55140.1 hypothetical protein [Candidatus Sumerlaeia bacterium]